VFILPALGRVWVKKTEDMEMDEMQRLRLRCLLLEADMDAEIAAKNVYRNKLSELAGEGDTARNRLAVNEPQPQPVCQP